jgi:6-phosphogluconolactonase
MRAACTVALACALAACGGAGSGVDGGVDAGPDASVVDSGAPVDAGGGDAGAVDAGTPDAGPLDAGAVDAGAPRDAWVYVGSGDGRITTYRLDADAGSLQRLGDLAAGPNPSYLAFQPSARRLYAVNEATTGQLSAFEVQGDGGLALLNRVSSSGSGPAHLAVDPSGRWVAAANYGGGQVPVVAVADAGLGATVDVETPGTNPHLVAFTPDARFAFVPCKGSDRVAQFRFDAATGQLSPNGEAATATGAGPRHLVVHGSGAWAFLVNELDSTLSSYAVGSGGALALVETKSTLPAGFMGTNTGAHIALHPSGRFVYASNRGDDSVVGFRVDESTGRLTLIGHVKSGGVRPRTFTLTPDGALLLAANQGSGTVHAFRVDAATGALTALGLVATVNAPAFVGAVAWPDP